MQNESKLKKNLKLLYWLWLECHRSWYCAMFWICDWILLITYVFWLLLSSVCTAPCPSASHSATLLRGGRRLGENAATAVDLNCPKAFSCSLVKLFHLDHKFACFFSSSALPHPTGNDGSTSVGTSLLAAVALSHVLLLSCSGTVFPLVCNQVNH